MSSILTKSFTAAYEVAIMLEKLNILSRVQILRALHEQAMLDLEVSKQVAVRAGANDDGHDEPRTVEGHVTPDGIKVTELSADEMKPELDGMAAYYDAITSTPNRNDPNWPLPSFDARDWAEAFCQQHPTADRELMLAWFANALMRGFGEGQCAPNGQEVIDTGNQVTESEFADGLKALQAMREASDEPAV